MWKTLKIYKGTALHHITRGEKSLMNFKETILQTINFIYCSTLFLVNTASVMILSEYNSYLPNSTVAQSVGAAEYTNCFSAMG